MRARGSWLSKAKYLPLAVPLFGIAELGAHVYFSRRAPTEKDWADIRPLVASWYKAGSVVVVAPYWAEPMARWKFGDALMPPRDVARPDATRYPEAIEVSALGDRSPELTSWRVTREEKHGRITVRALANPSPPAVTYDFGDHVSPDALEVRTEKAGAGTACSYTTTAAIEGGGLGGPPIYPAVRFACPGEPSHVFVGTTIIEDQVNRPRRCIWAHPPAGESELVAKFRDVPLGNVIHGYAGMGWIPERDLAVPPFTIRVVVGTAEIGRFVHHPGDFWKGFDLPLGPVSHANADVEFHVSAPPGGTAVCFEADSR
jgi:hypothetical protein